MTEVDILIEKTDGSVCGVEVKLGATPHSRDFTALRHLQSKLGARFKLGVASELLHGVHRATDGHVRARRQAFVEYMISSIEPLPITTSVARTHAEIWAGLERDGEVIGSHDMWIAATAISHGMEIATANATEFERVPGLTVVAI